MSAFVYHAVVAHLVGDFLFQTDEMAGRKFDEWRIRAMHVTAYSVPFVILLGVAELSVLMAAVAFAYLWTTHYLIDTRRWAEPKPGFEQYPVVVDQTLHLLALVPVVEVIA